MENTTNELKENLKRILLKKAEGYFYDEKVEEYQKIYSEEKGTKSVSEQLSFNLDDINLNKAPTKSKLKGKMELVKKKVTTHHEPPDLSAIKMLLELFETSENKEELSSCTNEQLMRLKDQLIEELKKF